ncbi:hypothetical protein L585_13435 [Pantoea ananatis BRT175]|uniref:phage tail fiber domain-containing protein n=1 Tax=Pantoea ananas TaxID=553 RepID=UPI0003B18AEC|nr:phage tail fiber protein [Pantoea ananatis]ERM13477.1 hypothetical protein L585_13435 [Pantoea ananatis BRT175]
MSVPAQVPISGPYIANGVTTQFAYKFYLLFATDMQVFVGGLKKTLNTDYTVTGVGNSQGGNVVFTTAPANGLEVLIKRATPYTRQTDYADNGDLLADVVNDDFDRIWLALQEINASFSSSISKPVGGNWDAQGLRLTGLADGSQPQDAVTYNQLFTVNGSAGQSATAAADSATAAKNSENNAATSQQAAAVSAGAASVSAGNSSDSANLAQKWAANPVGTEVTTGKFSALHYASKASDSATSAANSAASASTSAGNASGSASAAAQSATSAKSDADRAQSANPDNQLKKASNLSDVADKAQSRKNLGVDYGTDVGTVAQGNDTRLGTVDKKSGGNITGTTNVNGGMKAWFTTPSSLLNASSPTIDMSIRDNNDPNGRDRTRFDMFAFVNSDGLRIGAMRVFSDAQGEKNLLLYQSDGRVRGTAGMLAIDTSSDGKLKNIDGDTDLNAASNRISSLRFVDYHWNEHPFNIQRSVNREQQQRGVIAQEAAKVDPYYVQINHQQIGGAMDGKTEEILTLNETAMLMDAMATIQLLSKKVATLEARAANQET